MNGLDGTGVQQRLNIPQDEFQVKLYISTCNQSLMGFWSPIYTFVAVLLNIMFGIKFL